MTPDSVARTVVAVAALTVLSAAAPSPLFAGSPWDKVGITGYGDIAFGMTESEVLRLHPEAKSGFIVGKLFADTVEVLFFEEVILNSSGEVRVFFDVPGTAGSVEVLLCPRQGGPQDLFAAALAVLTLKYGEGMPSEDGQSWYDEQFDSVNLRKGRTKVEIWYVASRNMRGQIAKAKQALGAF